MRLTKNHFLIAALPDFPAGLQFDAGRRAAGLSIGGRAQQPGTRSLDQPLEGAALEEVPQVKALPDS